MSSRWVGAMLAGVVAGLATVAAAGPAPTVVVYSGDEDLTRSAWMQQHGGADGVRFVPIDDVLPGPSNAVLLGDALVVSCEGEGVSPAELTTLNRDALDQLAMMEYLDAATSLQRADTMMPCLSGAPRPMDLAAYHMLRGIVAFETDGPEEASARFEEGLLVSPFLQWDERFPPSVKPSFDAAVKTAIAAERGFLSVSSRILGGGALWLDGLAVDPRTRTTTVYEGRHLVQWSEAGGAVQSWMVEVRGGDSLVLVHRADAGRALLTGAAGPLLSRFGRDRVLAPVERGPGALMVAEEGAVVLFHRFDATAGAWIRADVDAIEDFRADGRRLRNAGVALAIGGGVMAIVGVVDLLVGGSRLATIDKDVRGADITQPEVGDDVGPIEVFNNQRGARASAANQVRFGLTFGIVGSALSLGSIPVVVIGEGRAHALGLHRARRAVGEGGEGEGEGQ